MKFEIIVKEQQIKLINELVLRELVLRISFGEPMKLTLSFSLKKLRVLNIRSDKPAKFY